MSEAHKVYSGLLIIICRHALVFHFISGTLSASMHVSPHSGVCRGCACATTQLGPVQTALTYSVTANYLILNESLYIYQDIKI